MNNQKETVYGGLKMKTKIMCVLALLLVGVIAISGIANADSVPATIESLQIDGKEVDMYDWTCDSNGDCFMGELRGDLLRGDKLEVEVKLEAFEDDKNIEVEASIRGLDHDKEKAVDTTDTFSVKEGRTYWKTLEIELPQRMDADRYLLRIEVSNRDGWEQRYELTLDVEVARNAMQIKDTVFSPSGSVKAGASLYVVPRLKNIGDNEEDVKVTVEIPELGIAASDYVDDIEEEDTVTAKELYLRIPECAEAGAYKAEVTVEYDDGDESVTEEYIINVVGSEVCNVGTQDAGKTVLTVGNDMQDVTAGQSGVVYPISLSNTGNTAKTYTVSAVSGDWAEVKVSPSVVVLGAGETKFAYVSVAAKSDATAGQKTFGVTIKSGDKTLQEVTLKANVLEPKNTGWDKVRNGLQVALVVLVVLLVIVGLIIGFNRLKGDEDDDFQEESYY